MTAIACFVAVILVTVGFTAVAARRTRSAADFYVAGSRIGGFQNGLAIAGDFMSAATILMEGSREEVAFQEKGLYKLAKEYDGLPGGAENGRRGYRLTFAIAYIRDFLSDFHILGETFETSVPWNRIHQVCDAVVARAQARHQELDLPGRPYVSYRITQVYHTGVCIYFMFGFYAKGVEDPETVFSQVEHSLRQAIIDAGGSISHHHGVGKLRSEFMKHTLSSRGIRLLKEIKRSADPNNIFGIRNNVLGD